jgi:acetyl esterase/lipase
VDAILLTLSLALTVAEAKPAEEPLWPRGAPGAKGSEAADKPTITIYPAPREKNCGAAVVVCPGGGYGGLAITYEGHDIGRWLNGHGITALVLKYRHAPRYRHPAPLQDAQRALRTARARAREWGVDPGRVGIWGFSAGGHLAATAATHFDDGTPDAADPVERVSCRPDFAILAYPVITFQEPFLHRGSRDNLLGTKPAADLVENLSNETQVSARTPPAFLFHTSTDGVVPAENSVQFYLALRKARVPAELHIYEKGRHGVGLALADPVLSSWPKRLVDWLEGRGILRRKKP